MKTDSIDLRSGGIYYLQFARLLYVPKHYKFLSILCSYRKPQKCRPLVGYCGRCYVLWLSDGWDDLFDLANTAGVDVADVANELFIRYCLRRVQKKELSVLYGNWPNFSENRPDISSFRDLIIFKELCVLLDDF